MPLKLTCPECQQAVPLAEPFPLPGSLVQCPSCTTGLAVTYPSGFIEKLKARGKRFAEAAPAPAPARPAAAAPKRPPVAPPPPPPPKVDPPSSSPATEVEGTPVEPEDRTVVATPGALERTARTARTPWGNLANDMPEGGSSGATPPPPRPARSAAAKPPAPTKAAPTKARPAKASKPRSPLRWLVRFAALTALAVVCTGTLGACGAGGGYWYYGQDLPSIEALQGYEPPTVTTVYDRNGALLGEIYEQRRYVVPYEEIPEHVRNAFIAAEDANFYDHGGVDYMGIARAMVRNAQQGRMAQGASTITQQVTRNFLLTKDKKIERKVKEILLSWRIEEAYSKQHILYLYLNEIYLGSGAYGVEAASRVYFGKHVQELTVAEAAMLAGLPQRPSDYSPHRSFEKARERQDYVLHQMVDNGYLTEAQYTAERARTLDVVQRENEFLKVAPHFTEHIRRYLVDTYGHDKVYNEGLRVVSTCDLELQNVAQKAVTDGVADVDQRMGFRREEVETVVGAAAIAARRDAQEKAMREAWAKAEDAAGRVAAPDASVLKEGERYEAVVLEVQPKWARVGVGAHEGMIPIAWADWIYVPNPKVSWRGRAATDLTAKVADGGTILRAGDILTVEVRGASTQADLQKVFANTPGATKAFAAVAPVQVNEVEGALLSMDLKTGAVLAMVGGSSFEKSEFNRATQSRRQVGSTFKPIVYAAAINSKSVTAASIVPDAPLAFAAQNADFIWKPSNYGNDYLGNITLRRALALSRNTCTVRVLDTIDPGMNDDVIYSFARSLGIGGPPTYRLPEDWVASPDTDLLCPWLKEEPDFTICMDRIPEKDPTLTDSQHRARLRPEDEYFCRACDMSMGLGSASLTMEELVRAYSPFGATGKLIEPYYVQEVRDRSGAVLEDRGVPEHPQVVDPGVATIVNWLLQGVVDEGTGSPARELGLEYLAGKTGTTNDEKDTWFIGFTPEVISAVWVGFDQPKSLGVSSTGGRTALPIWIEYMRAAAPKANDRPFKTGGSIEWANIDEATGRRVTSGGRSYPFLEGTVPESSGAGAGQITMQDVTEL